MTRAKTLANSVSGVLGFIAPTYFAWTVYRDSIPQNVATWSMIMLLDCLGLTLVYKSGNTRPFMQIGWFAASLCVLTAIFAGGSPWHWGRVETLSLVLCLVAVCLWLALNAKVALIAYLVAFMVSGVPMIVDYWHEPQPSTTWLWLVTVFTCALSAYAAEERDIPHLAVPVCAILLNGFLAYLCVR